MSDNRLSAPAVQRNRDPILEVLRQTLPSSGLVLEIASGTGEHVIHFATAFPGLTFQPTDHDDDALASIADWTASSGLKNIRPPIALDATAQEWPISGADAIICINMVHISPWAATLGLLTKAAKLLPANGPLYLYGPYRRPDRALEPSNLAFDRSLRERNPDWGLRDLATITRLATEAGFAAPKITEMPANNLSVVFRRASLA